MYGTRLNTHQIGLEAQFTSTISAIAQASNFPVDQLNPKQERRSGIAKPLRLKSGEKANYNQ
jgi:hypothetical protein